MEVVPVVRHQLNVSEELNIVDYEQVHVVQYRQDIIRHDVMDQIISVQDKRSVQHESIVWMERNIHVYPRRNIVQSDQVCLNLYQMDIIRTDAIAQTIIVNDKVSVECDIIVKMGSRHHVQHYEVTIHEVQHDQMEQKTVI